MAFIEMDFASGGGKSRIVDPFPESTHDIPRNTTQTFQLEAGYYYSIHVATGTVSGSNGLKEFSFSGAYETVDGSFGTAGIAFARSTYYFWSGLIITSGTLTITTDNASSGSYYYATKYDIVRTDPSQIIPPTDKRTGTISGIIRNEEFIINTGISNLKRFSIIAHSTSTSYVDTLMQTLWYDKDDDGYFRASASNNGNSGTTVNRFAISSTGTNQRAFYVRNVDKPNGIITLYSPTLNADWAGVEGFWFAEGE